MSNVFSLLLAREARLLFRRPAELANPLVFFAIVIALFPLAVGPESQLLQTLSPGLVWVAALLAVLLSLEGLFRSDFEDGSLEQWVLSPHPLALLVLAKVLAHWLFSGLALVLMSPLFALMLGLPARCIPVLLLSLLLGTPVLSPPKASAGVRYRAAVPPTLDPGWQRKVCPVFPKSPVNRA